MFYNKIFQKKYLKNLLYLKIGFVFSSLYSVVSYSSDEQKASQAAHPLSYLKCINTLKLAYKKGIKPSLIKKICQKTQVLSECNISGQYDIVHYNRLKQNKSDAKRNVLVLSAFHGDEPESLEFTLQWIKKLMKSESLGANFKWRFVPLVNPTGLKKGTRMNGNKVDLNRNFPTKDWDRKAISYWKNNRKMDPRRFPGHSPGSEAEVKCIIAHISDFSPDFVIAVHTPYGLLDMDGPLLGNKYPSFRGFPWKKLGTKTGSLGRYLWTDRKIPVLTIELPHSSIGYYKMQKMFFFSDQVIEKTLNYVDKNNS